MKTFEAHQLDLRRCQQEVLELQTLLAEKRPLAEQAEIQPFFQERKDLSAWVGVYAGVPRCDRIAWEYDLWGKFRCDLVVGDSVNHCFNFIEFEDACTDSIFVQRGRSTPEWSPRFEHGFGQIIDWFHILDDLQNTAECEARFGARSIDYTGMLIAGRDADLKPPEQQRLKWRRKNVVVGTNHIYCITFDELLDDILTRIRWYFPAAELDK